MKPTACFLVLFVLPVSACKSEPVDLGLMCNEDAEATVRRSSAVAYGVDIPPPQVTGVHPLAEADLFGIDIADADRLGLLASDASGALHHRVCSTVLCDLEDAQKVLSACEGRAGCKIVGAVRSRTFYPLYLADTGGGHVCAPRWK